jgi:2-keto-4-pentenoate hydratase/2-oxohepta-3-ene-1,7-dioic acid hydratase in catechol pathway
MVRLVTIEDSAGRRVAVEQSDGGDYADITKADGSLPSDMRSLLEKDGGVAAAAAAAAKAPVIKRADAKLMAPIYNPEKIICIGMNYVDHCTEQNMPVPTEPVVFSKFASCITEPGAPIELIPETNELDFEVEMCIVIGKQGRRITKAEAYDYVAGYTVAHDVSARDWQLKRNGAPKYAQWLMGKTFDTYAPIGPAIVSTDEIGDINNKGIRCRLNGETVQDSNTNQLVFDVPTLLEWVSAGITLKPGDLIFTGTPPGVGCFRKPPLWLKDGDVVDVEIDGIGCITNPIKAEDGPAAKKAKN